ncbi:Hsp20/alpha crystallin family protein [Bacillus sp. Marseille-Q3570]|uniref:Hsp20/alpha crystallin family protein n=1 Tax=Bacillus sp. Marseille-Q3570 TaxID=2963522 RepID=UPI0021B7D562|nr:Hsp20/alpha crystallin family protein [Bacillus sp. Marseille-Q3570]
MDFWKNQLKHIFDDQRMDNFLKSIDQHLQQSMKEFDKHLNHFQSNYFFDVDTSETDREIIIRANLPLEENDRVNLEVINHQLRLLIQKFETEQLQNDKGEILRKENYSKRIERYLPLPPNVLTEDIKASMSGNQLTVKLPKTHDTQSKIIDIEPE